MIMQSQTPTSRNWIILACLFFILLIPSRNHAQSNKVLKFSSERKSEKAIIRKKGEKISQDNTEKFQKYLNKSPDEKCGLNYVSQLYNTPSIEVFEKWMSERIAAQKSDNSYQPVITIPVVVHVIHNGETEGDGSNISEAQVLSQLEVLNEDFRRLNADASNTPKDFKNVAADLRLEFCLATVDPDGNPTNGITRYNGGQPVYFVEDLDFNIKPNTVWNPEYYFNIWVAPLFGNLLGYAQFPEMSMLPGLPPEIEGGPNYTDGIVVRDIAFGTTGSALSPWNLGRTATHEVGHFFGLRHMGGDGDCSVDDYCADTPTQDGQNNNFEDDCSYPADNDCDDGPGDLPDQFMNFMDYSDDACMNLFTKDQKARVQAVLANSPRRNFANSQVCNGVQPPSWEFDKPDNDLCMDATLIECNQDFYLSTNLFNTDTGSPTECGLDPNTPGIWYRFEGTGDILHVTIFGSSFIPQVTVYTGSCGDLTCEPVLTDFFTTIIQTLPGETYFLYINNPGPEVGNVFVFAECTSNDLCDNAISVQCGDVLFGNTIGTTTIGTPSTDCRLFDVQDEIDNNDPTIIPDDLGPGIWYKMTGTGQRIILSTCDQASFDTKIDVFTGSCDNLICVEGNDDGQGCGGFSSAFGFDSQLGEEYFIYVSGFTINSINYTETGVFTLSVCPDCTIESIALDPGFVPPGGLFCLEDGNFVLGFRINGPMTGNVARNNDGTVDINQLSVIANGEIIPILEAGEDDITDPPFTFIYFVTTSIPGNGDILDVKLSVRDDCMYEEKEFLQAPECSCYTGAGPDFSICSGGNIALTAESNNTLSGGNWELLQGAGSIDNVNDPTTFYIPGPEETSGEIVVAWIQPSDQNCAPIFDVLTITLIECVPTMSEWSILILSLILVIIGILAISAYKLRSQKL